MEKRTSVRNILSRKIASLSVNKGELKRIFTTLQERSYAAAEIEISKFEKGTQSDDDYEKNKNAIRGGFELKLTIVGVNGKELFGNINDLFDSPNFPEEIKSIYVNSEGPLKAIYNYHPQNSFEVFMDFSKPNLFNLSFQPSQETPNESNIKVQGYDSTWTHGVFSEFTKFIDDLPSKFAWIHKHSVYDFLVWIAGLPLGFWFAYRLSEILNRMFGSFSMFVLNAAYVYIFFATLILFRMLFHYARWIFPLVEYKHPRNRALKHRITLVTITLGLIAGLIHDVVKLIFNNN